MLELQCANTDNVTRQPASSKSLGPIAGTYPTTSVTPPAMNGLPLRLTDVHPAPSSKCFRIYRRATRAFGTDFALLRKRQQQRENGIDIGQADMEISRHSYKTPIKSIEGSSVISMYSLSENGF